MAKGSALSRKNISCGICLITLTTFIWICFAGVSRAEIAGPGWFTVKSPPVSLTGKAIDVSVKTTSTPVESLTTTLEGEASATDLSPEIVELARSLQHDPKLIYDYVHNHIDYVPYYGALKGATLTYLDGCGNDFDQAALMIALLRQSGYSAQFVCGRMTMPGSILANWLGVDQTWEAIGKVITGGGIPYYYLYEDGTMIIDRVCVQTVVDGAAYLFDPAYKTYEYVAKIDLAAATGYDRSALLAAAGGIVDGGSVQGLNAQALSDQLTSYATALVNAIRAEHPNSSVEEIVGGRKIVSTFMDGYSTSLPFPTSDAVLWDEIPSDKTATLSIQHAGIDHVFYVPEIAGKRLTITYAGSDNHPELRLDQELIASGSSTTAGATYALNIVIDHPYELYGNYCDQAVPYNIVSGGTCAIMCDFGGASDALLSERQKKLDLALADGLAETSEPVLGETLNIMGLAWNKELLRTERLLEALTETRRTRQHIIGIMVQDAGYHIDVKGIYLTVNSLHNIDEDRKLFAKVHGAMASAFEHGVLEQLPGSENPALSTIKLLSIANAAGYKVFFADKDNYAAIKPQLVNYSSSLLYMFQSYVDSGYDLILPQSGYLGLGQWRGAGYIAKADLGSGMVMAMMISGNYYGGYCSVKGGVDPNAVSNNAGSGADATNNDPGVNNIIDDPVDMSSGAYVYDHTDLALGGPAPMGLAFARSYSSKNHLEDRGLGFGWTHNCDIRLSRFSHGDPGLGSRQPVDAAAMIAALYINLDLMKNQDDIQGWTVSALINKWAVDQLIDNAVSVYAGDNVMEYIRLANGAYAPPPGCTTELVDNGDSTFSLLERFGTRLDFDEEDRITQGRDVDGNKMTFAYSEGKLTTIQDAFGRTLTLTYSGDRIESVSDSTGRVVSFGYDSGDLVSFLDPEAKPWSYGYDPDHRHRMTRLSDPLFVDKVINAYDSLGRMKNQSLARQGEDRDVYNFYFAGFRNLVEDPEGNQTIYYYDHKNRAVGEENALGHKTSRSYDGQNHIVETVDPRQNVASFVYDGSHNLTKIINALNQETELIHDPLHRLTDIVDALDHRIHFGYDSEHHLTGTQTYPQDGKQIQTSATYYGNGLPETLTDAMNTVTTLTYDGNGCPQSSQTDDAPALVFDFDAVGRMESLTDQVGSETRFVYDDRSLLLTRTDALSNPSEFSYYDNGRLHAWTDRNHETTTYVFTPLGKLESATYPDSSAVSFIYNSQGRMSQMNDSLGQTIFGYDAAGRLTTLTDAHGFTVGYEYDAAGNVSAIIYPGGKTVSYAYDALNRLKSATIEWLGRTAIYHYDAAGRLYGVDRFNASYTGYGHDDANRLTSVSHTRSDNSVIASFDFTLDDNGNRIHESRQAPLKTILSTSALEYGYNDFRNRLETAGEVSFEYDLEGQLSSKNEAVYVFDYEHRLTDISGTTQYSYDGLGRRLAACRNGIATRYVYDASGNLLAEADENNAIVRYYIYGCGLLAMATASDQLYCYHFDGTGNTIAMTDASQTIVNSYAYTPFGVIVNARETIAQPFKYVGEYGVMAEPNGLCYMRNRYYDPEVGRFISEDPIGFDGGDVNLYAYIRNNPIDGIDPWGLAQLRYSRESGVLTVKPDNGSEYSIQATSGNTESEPLPPGAYKIDSKNLTDPNFIGDVLRNTRGDWGDWRVPIESLFETDRSGFFIHCGSIPGSAGCIDIGGGLFGNSLTDHLKNDLLNDPESSLCVE